MKRSRLLFVAAFAALTLLATGCLGGTGATGGGGGEGTIDVFGAFTDFDADNFNNAVTSFEEESGYDVVYTGSADFETLITTRIAGGDPPDVTIFPQPGLMAELARSGDLTPLDFLNRDEVVGGIVPGLGDTLIVDDQLYGVPMRLAVKSLLWYPIPEFEEAGYVLPSTQEELDALIAEIEANGGTPWCSGVETGGATGWPLTDWVEEYMLRLHGPDVYDAWVNHEIPFDAPEVQAAFERVDEVLVQHALGGASGILATQVEAAPAPMFEDPPGCWLYRQGSFAVDFFPDDAVVGEDVGVSYFPGSEQDRPVLGGGDIATLSNDTEAARAFLEWMATADAMAPWAEAGGLLSPWQEFDASRYPDEATREVGEILQSATVFRFDASDLMPGPVGAGSFWSEPVAWLNGTQDLQTTLSNIEASWPAEGA